MLFEKALLFLLNYLYPPHVNEPFLLNLPLLFLFCLSILLQFDLPELFHFSFMLQLLHSSFFSCHLLYLFIFRKFFEHFQSKLFRKHNLIFFLFFFHLLLLSFGITKQLLKQLFFLLFFGFFSLIVFLAFKLIVFHSNIL